MKILICLMTLLFSGVVSQCRAQDVIPTRLLPDLPIPISNNATALLSSGGMVTLFFFKGLEEGKSWQETSLKSFALSLGHKSWREIRSVPGASGQLAATAVGLGGKVFIFGGYTVAADHSEVTVARSYEYDPKADRYRLLPEIPVAVDDSVSFTVAGRYIYLISGWHNSGNVNLSQVYDTVEKRWFQATPYPGSAVFGHAGAALGNRFVVCDGVEKKVPYQGRHKYQAVSSCFKGEVDPAKPQVIKWQRIKSHPGKARYRMAAGGYQGLMDWIIFVGGSDNPYNYNGIGYDKKPSQPSDLVMAFSLDDNQWHVVGSLGQPSMDHRSLLVSGNRFFIVGGMTEGQKVSNRGVEFCLSDRINDQNGKLISC